MDSPGAILSMLRHSQDATLLYTSRELHIGYINEAMLRILNKTKAIEGKRLEDVAPEFGPYFPMLKDLWQSGEKLILKESPADIDFEGNLVTTYFDIEYQPLQNEQGETIAIINTARDVSERMRAQRLLDEKIQQTYRNEQFLNRLIMEAPAGLALMRGPQYTYTIINDAYQAILPGRKLTGRGFFDAVPELKGTPIEQVLYEVYHQGTPYSFSETLVPLSDYEGGPTVDRYFTFNYLPWIDDKGAIDGILNLAVEVTDAVRTRLAVETLNADLERANAEELHINAELSAANQKLVKLGYEAEQAEYTSRIAIEAANFGTWHLDTHNRKLVANDRLKELFGFPTQQEVTLADYISRISVEYRDQVSAAIDATIKTGGKYDLTYTVEVEKGQAPKWVRAIGNLQADSNGELSLFTGLLIDISEQKADEQRKSDFIGMVSHELKTPITSLNAYLQMLQGKARQAEDSFTLGALDQSVKQVKRMTKMINGFLNVSRLESGKISIDKQLFDMAELIKEVEAETIPMYSSHQIIFALVEETMVEADRDKIGQVISNLISNAVKYSKPGNMVNVACVTLNNEAVVSVMDEGIGIEKKEIERLFERYYRVEANQHISGFGIGLYLSAEIIERHHGRIWEESEPGAGSTFYFSLPVAN